MQNQILKGTWREKQLQEEKKKSLIPAMGKAKPSTAALPKTPLWEAFGILSASLKPWEFALFCPIFKCLRVFFKVAEVFSSDQQVHKKEVVSRVKPGVSEPGMG